MTKVLNCAASDELRALREALLRSQDCQVVSVKTATDAMVELASSSFDVLLVCHQIATGDAEVLCKEFRRRFPRGRIVAVATPELNRPLCNAEHHVSPFNPGELLSAVVQRTTPLS